MQATGGIGRWRDELREFAMNILSYFEQAWVNLVSAKLRSFLAILGILVGTAAVVALISCGNLATEKALEQFKAMGTDLMAVSLFSQSRDKSHSERSDFSLTQWRHLKRQIPEIEKIAPYSSTYQSLSYQGKAIKGALIGADSQLQDILALKLKKGRFVSSLESYEHVLVIGHDMAEQIKAISPGNPLGKQLRVGNSLYTIIGILDPWKENAFFNENIDMAVIIPIAGMSLLKKDNKITQAIIQLTPNSNIDIVIKHLKQMIHLQVPKLSVFPRSARQIIAGMENQGRIFTLLLGVIGSISLLVGGIGVMNVMLVSVSERKKEIGIRKALGAKQLEIQRLFLSEAMMLGVFGGMLGLALGLCVTAIIAAFSHWSMHFYLLPNLAGLIVSLCTCLFFGYYPARRAARLDPIVSLHHD
jgi:putative ABC transport system permease protein